MRKPIVNPSLTQVLATAGITGTIFTLVSLAHAQPYGPGGGPGMMGWGGFAPGAPFGMIGWVFGLVVLIALAAWFVRSINRQSGERHASQPVARQSAGLAALDERYARGEISREDYLTKRRDIEG